MVVQQLVVILLFLCEEVSSNPSTPVSCPELKDFYKYGCLLPISSVCAGCYPLGMGCVFVVVLPHSQDSEYHALAICFHFSWESIKSIVAGLYGSYMFQILINSNIFLLAWCWLWGWDGCIKIVFIFCYVIKNF